MQLAGETEDMSAQETGACARHFGSYRWGGLCQPTGCCSRVAAEPPPPAEVVAEVALRSNSTMVSTCACVVQDEEGTNPQMVLCGLCAPVAEGKPRGIRGRYVAPRTNQ